MGSEAAREARSDTSVESPEDWYAHLMWIERRKCLLFTNVGTLFPFIMLGVRKSQLVALRQTFRAEYERNLIQAGATPSQAARELSHSSRLQIGKSGNRRVLGSMTDYAHLARGYVERLSAIGPAESLLVSGRLAEAPMSVIAYSTGIDQLREKLASYAT